MKASCDREKRKLKRVLQRSRTRVLLTCMDCVFCLKTKVVHTYCTLGFNAMNSLERLAYTEPFLVDEIAKYLRLDDKISVALAFPRLENYRRFLYSFVCVSIYFQKLNTQQSVLSWV